MACVSLMMPLASAQSFHYTTDPTAEDLQLQLGMLQRQLDKQAEAMDELERQRYEIEASKIRKSEDDAIHQMVSSLERQFIAGNGLNNDQVEWVKGAGWFARNRPTSIYRPYLRRLYALYFAEKRRRGR